MESRSKGDSLGKVVVVGQGYVGLPLAMRAVAVGRHVVGYDVSFERVKHLQNAESFIEDVTDSEIADALASGRYAATCNVDDCRNFDIAVITVPTPLREGNPDLSFIESAEWVSATWRSSFIGPSRSP